MSRVVLALWMCVAVLFVGGCASGEPPEPEARRLAPVRTRIVTCTTTVERENVCRLPKNCPQIDTCAEAYYRLVTCGHKWLDGAPKNGVPCERKCGGTAEARERQIANEGGPFIPKTRQVGERICTPPA
jgi:hypothetical protein